jgi:hypothetical protein
MKNEVHMTKKMIFFSVLISATSALAAIPPKAKKALSNSAILRGGGAIHGGLAGRGFSLLDVKSFPAKNQKLERLAISVGDPLLQVHAGAPGYFHIENKIEAKQVVINFDQTYNTKFDEKMLQQTFANSPFVKSSQILFEPEAKSMSLVLTLKKAASIRAIPVMGKGTKTAQLNIDLFEDVLLAKKSSARAPAAKIQPRKKK